MYSTSKRKINDRLRRHKLLPQAIRPKLPALTSIDGQWDQAVAQVKLFTPDSSWYWYATEFDGQDTLYGLVFGSYVELGYFSLAELEELRGPLGLPVERDRSFRPATLAAIIREHRQQEGEIRHYMI